tara:strand:- start:9797 stop:10051 length:255 start_codon:yes stop_codon:yes gene_type:complete
VDDIPKRARDTVARIMDGYIYKIDLEACELLLLMADLIDEYEKKEHNIECGNRGCKKKCQKRGASTKMNLSQKIKLKTGLEKPD